MMQDTTHEYDDIINLPHPDPQVHQRMPISIRAAQFMPFAALRNDDDEEDIFSPFPEDEEDWEE